MTIGQVSDDLEAIVPIWVHWGAGRPERVEAVLDTGFNGYLSLPPDLISRFKLEAMSNTAVTLGDGREAILTCYKAKAGWRYDGREIIVVGVDGAPLVGTAMFAGHVLRVESWRGGGVAVHRRTHEPKSDFAIRYDVTGAGWCECWLKCPQGEQRCTASYLGDPLGELVRAALTIHTAGTTQVVTFPEEPGEYQWRIVPDGRRVHIDVTWCREWSPMGPHVPRETVLAGSGSLQDFVLAVYLAADRVLATLGAESYRGTWIEHEFPLAEFAQLHAVAVNWLRER